MPNYIINVKEKGAKKASRNISGLSTALGGMASKAALAAGSFFGANMLLSGMKNAIDLAGKQELAEKKLEASLGRTSQALLNQARALQQVSTFGDEAIIEAQALIAAFVDDEEAVKAATVATLDLAAAKGMDLTVAADLVSKTLGSSTNVLSRYGIQVEGAVGSTERLESLTGNLADVFGGQASAQADTMTGSIEQAKNAMGDATETIGELLSPAVIRAAKFFKGAAEAVDTYLFSLRELDEEAIKNEGSHEKIGAAITRTKVRLGQLAASPFKDSPLFGGDVREEIEKLEGRLVQLNTQYNALNILSTEGHSMLLSDFESFRLIADGYGISVEKVKEPLTDIEKALADAAFEQKILNDMQEESIKTTTGRADAFSKLTGSLGKLNTASKGSALVSGRLAQAGAIADTYAGANKAFAQGGVLGFATGAAIIASGLANVVNISRSLGDIKAAATGADFVTNGKQLLMVGDNPSGREHVQVTPLGGDPAPNAPSRASITVNVSGNVLSQDFVEGELAENIKEAVRRGTDFGIS